MSRPDIVAAAEQAPKNDWTAKTLSPLSVQEVDERLPLALIVQTAAQLLATIQIAQDDGNQTEAWREAGRCRKAADDAIRLIDNCHLAREDYKRKVKARLEWEKKAFALPARLAYEKGVRHITSSKTLDEKYAAFRGWLRFVLENMPGSFFKDSYSALTAALASSASPEEFETRAIEILTKRGFTNFAAVDFQERFENFYRYWTTDKRRANGKKGAAKKRKLK